MGPSLAPSHHLTRLTAQVGSLRASAVVIVAALAAVTGWAFWPTLVTFVHVWSTDDGYSHGFLVPAFAAFVLWLRRDRFPEKRNPRPFLGVAVIVLALALRAFAGLRFNKWPEEISLVPYLLGLAVCFGGGPLLRWSAPAILFLVFMVPLPYRLEVSLGAPLQQLATLCSTFLLQTFGQPAIAEGNTILLREQRLEVVQACSGLKMLVTFVTFATAVCLLVQRPLSDKLVILASAVPIALVVNIARITVTGLMLLYVSGESARALLHDAAGWVMMPAALALLGLELWVLNRLIVESPARRASVKRR